MSNNINSVGGPSGPTPDELNIAKGQKDQQQQSYLVSSELQFMISSLQTMAAQLQNRIAEAKEAKAEEGNTAGTGSAAPSAPQTLPVSALADLSHCPAGALGFTESFLTNPSLTEGRASLLLSSTNLDNAVQQLTGLAAPLKNALASNVNPSSMEGSLQKLLPSVQAAIGQLESTRSTLAETALHPSLQPLKKGLLDASDALIKHLSPAPSSTADLPAFSLKMTDQVENQTSALQQMHLQHQKTANQVGGDLKMVLPQSNMQGAAPRAGLGGAAPAGGLGGAGPASGNPWSGVWKWLLGSNGLMANIGSKMMELTKLLKYQSNAMKDFSGMLTLFADLANWGIPSHFNPSLAHNDKTGYEQFQNAVKALQAHWATLVGGKTPKGKETIKPSQALFYKVREDMRALAQYGAGKSPKIPGLYSLIQGMEKNFYNMYNDMNVIRHMGPPDFVTTKRTNGKKGISKATFTYVKMAANPSLTIWVDKKRADGVTYWTKSKALVKLNQFLTNGAGKALPSGAFMRWSAFQKYQRGIFTNFNLNQNKFQQIAKDGGSNIQSLQTSTQSQVKLYMLYYQQIMQTAPSIVQTLAQLIMAVSANFKGGQ